MTKKLNGFVIVQGDKIQHGTFNAVRHVSQAKMVVRSNVSWAELENGGYSVRECEATFSCANDGKDREEVLGNGGEPIIERNEDPVRDDK